MMTHRPFESFCRENFVDSGGNIQSINSASKEAKRVRIQRHRNKLTYQLRTLKRSLSNLEKGMKDMNPESEDGKRLSKQSANLRQRIEKARQEIKKTENK